MTVLQPTRVAGRYHLGELLGRGGMADVYRARDSVLERDVAVKMLRNPADPVHRARFVAEAGTLAALDHPHIVTLLDAGLDDEFPFLVMDLVAGRTLSEHAAGFPLEPTWVRRVGAQVAAALAHAHAAGVVHRDVKPSNILLDAEGQAFLSDFGIARLLGSVDRHTRADELVGSPAFLAPEQVEAGELTAAADIYSLGLVLLEMLTGRRAYPGSPVETAIARLRVAPLIPTSLGPDLGRLLEQMTRLDPAARPTAAEVARALEGRPPVPSTDPTTTLRLAPVPDDLQEPGRSRRRAIGIGVVAAAAAAVLLPVVLAAGADGHPPAATRASATAATVEAAPVRSARPAVTTVHRAASSVAKKPGTTKPRKPKGHRSAHHAKPGKAGHAHRSGRH